MARVYFTPNKLPRNWTKKQWLEAWRWVRSTRKECEKLDLIKVNLINNGNLSDKQKKDMIHDLIYPPVILGPGMEL